MANKKAHKCCGREDVQDRERWNWSSSDKIRFQKNMSSSAARPTDLLVLLTWFCLTTVFMHHLVLRERSALAVDFLIADVPEQKNLKPSSPA